MNDRNTHLQDRVLELTQTIILSSVSERFIVYMVEIVFVMSLSEIVAALVGTKPYLFNAVVSYRLGELSFSYVLSQGFAVNIIIFTSIAFLYFLFEGIYRHGLGRILTNKEIIDKYVRSRMRRIGALMIRAAIKACPFLVFADTLFILRKNNRKFLQRGSDAALGFVVVKNKIVNSKKYEVLREKLRLYVVGASLFYYSLFISTFVVSWMIVPMAASTGGTAQARVNLWSEFLSILSQNLPFDFYLVSGGVTLSFGSLLFLVESLDTENAILVSILKSPSSVNFISGVLPQFIPESLGYVLGISAAFAIASSAIVFFQSMIHKQTSLSLSRTLVFNSKYILASTGLSIAFLVIAAYIEASLF